MEEGLPQEIDFNNEIRNCERVKPLLKNEWRKSLKAFQLEFFPQKSF